MKTIIKNGIIQHIDIQYSEDNKSSYKVKRLMNGNMVRDKVYELFYESDGYIFKCTQSGFDDNSGLNHGINGYHSTVGQAVDSVLNGPRSIYGDLVVFYNDEPMTPVDRLSRSKIFENEFITITLKQ